MRHFQNGLIRNKMSDDKLLKKKLCFTSRFPLALTKDMVRPHKLFFCR